MKFATLYPRHFKIPSIKFVVLTAILIYLPLIGLVVFSVTPPQVQDANSQVFRHQVDAPLFFEVFGSVQPNEVKLITSPPTPVKISINKGVNPLKYQVEVIPESIFLPDTNYNIEVIIPNWLGVESKKILKLKTGGLPKIVSATPGPQAQEVAADSALVFKLSSKVLRGDYLFTAHPSFPFTLKKAGDKISVTPLDKLVQGQNYKITLSYSDTNTTFAQLYVSDFTTVNPLNLISTNPTMDSLSVLKQTPLQFAFDKPIVKESFENNFSISPLTPGALAWLDDKNVQFIPTNSLLTNTNYSVTLGDQVKAVDNSQLADKITLDFKTAGPVKVVSTTPSGGAASLGSSITLTFDQPVDHTSAEKSFSISPPTEGSFAWNSNSLIFKPKSLTPLTNYKINLVTGVVSLGGENSKENYSASFTTTSERIRTIGYSVAGRAITAYYFGKGTKKILLVGTLHGSESNTGTMLSSWINYLRANQISIGEDRTFIIVPYANPDGRLSRTRFNSHNVDLNRNFGTPDWQALTYWQNRSYPKGGGSGPFSEPEARALRDLILSENPSRTITYHSAANLILGDGIAQSFGDWYSAKTGYKRGGSDEENESGVSALGYIITGTLEEWATLRGHVTLVVEFISAGSSEYSRNLPALKGLLTYPI